MEMVSWQFRILGFPGSMVVGWGGGDWKARATRMIPDSIAFIEHCTLYRKLVALRYARKLFT